MKEKYVRKIGCGSKSILCFCQNYFVDERRSYDLYWFDWADNGVSLQLVLILKIKNIFTIFRFVAANHIMMIAISTICSGIMTLIVAVYPRKCIVIWSFVDQVFLAGFCILMSCVFVMVVAIEELRKEYKDDIINFHVYTALSFIASVCAIIDCVLYSKLLCCKGKAQDPEEEERIAENRRNSRKIV
ncbi:unnamed protein product [Caenorhabditis angaria]|uniref:Uncharacterized protein n=1 Tax=Caenorhabditis angaria TaxID=860376 RepID=A0A9P1IJS3_9PELO|nr:unnamed protein product [Caenorhabditis angaria]